MPLSFSRKGEGYTKDDVRTLWSPLTHMEGTSVRRGSPGAVGDLHAGTLALPASTLGGWAVAGAGATQAGSHGAAIGVRAGRPRRPRAKVPVHGEIPRLGSRHK